METLKVLLMSCLVILAHARPFHSTTSNFVLWNYLTFVQPQQVQVPVTHSVNLASQDYHYPTIEMSFKGSNSVDFHYQEPEASTQKTTTTATTSRPITKRPIKRRILVKNSTPKASAAAAATATSSVVDSLKSQLPRTIFEMARNIEGKMLLKKPFKFNVISPINVASVLSMLELGAKGQTNQELQNILGFDKFQETAAAAAAAASNPLARHYALGQMLESILSPPLLPPTTSSSPSPSSSSSSEPEINMARGIFMQTGYSMRQDYRTSVETIYQSQVTALNFQQRRPAVATKFINDWVQQQTNGKIGNILADGIDTSTIRTMLLVGAMHFKALWASSFMPQATSQRPFYPQGKQAQKLLVQTMGNGGEFNYYESKDYDCAIMALPFKAGASSLATATATTMYIILPNKSNEAKLRNLQASLTFDIIDEMISKMTKRWAFISLPKMHLSDTLDLKDVLKQLNVKNVFEAGKSDLSRITENNQISVDGFLHKIDLTVSETGIEAAAAGEGAGATAATANHLSRQDYDVDFRVDGPFMFFVRHEQTKLPILYGSVIEPVS